MQTRPLKHASFFPYAPLTPNDTNRAHYFVNPKNNLSLLIANCHSMVARLRKARPPENASDDQQWWRTGFR
jgi:hypothetical protein